MKKVSIIGVDLAKNVFQLHGAAADETVLFRKKLTWLQFHRFMAAHPACLVAMEACCGAHYWTREMRQLGHDVRLIAPRYVKISSSARAPLGRRALLRLDRAETGGSPGSSRPPSPPPNVSSTPLPSCSSSDASLALNEFQIGI